MLQTAGEMRFRTLELDAGRWTKAWELWSLVEAYAWAGVLENQKLQGYVARSVYEKAPLETAWLFND